MNIDLCRCGKPCDVCRITAASWDPIDGERRPFVTGREVFDLAADAFMRGYVLASRGVEEISHTCVVHHATLRAYLSGVRGRSTDLTTESRLREHR